MIFCNRCELLFQECRPLRGMGCPQKNDPAPPSEPQGPAPDTRAEPTIAAAVVFDHGAIVSQIKPILAVDFYGNEA